MLTLDLTHRPEPAVPDARIETVDVTVTRGHRRILDGVTLSLGRAELIAIVGPTGGGKSTLLGTLAGTIPADTGSVRSPAGTRIGMVPQDDIIHRDLPLRRTLLHAARLRLPATADVAGTVDAVLAALELEQQVDVPVSRLSGGQRKRASIAVELLDRPGVLLLDEPTAGLDPPTAAGLMGVLRSLTDTGCTVVVTTHQLADLAVADRVMLVNDGTVSELDDAAAASSLLAVEHERHHGRATALLTVTPGKVSNWTRWRALTHRNAEVLVRGRMTLAILLGVPILVVAMFAVLFEPGTFGPSGPADLAAASSVAYWLAFAGFFFGLTFGLLQIATEVPVARRERFSGVGIGAYLAAKVAVLLPLLVLVDTILVVVLRWTDRLPHASASTTAQLLGVLALDSAAALVLGLLLSALVSDTAQAAMALPMVCFPAVLFAGAIVPVDDMAAAGRMISVVTPARWAFEAIASNLKVPVDGTSVSVGAAALVAFALALTVAAVAATRRRL